jgi:hypothetical protein
MKTKGLNSVQLRKCCKILEDLAKHCNLDDDRRRVKLREMIVKAVDKHPKKEVFLKQAQDCFDAKRKIEIEHERQMAAVKAIESKLVTDIKAEGLALTYGGYGDWPDKTGPVLTLADGPELNAMWTTVTAMYPRRDWRDVELQYTKRLLVAKDIKEALAVLAELEPSK